MALDVLIVISYLKLLSMLEMQLRRYSIALHRGGVCTPHRSHLVCRDNRAEKGVSKQTRGPTWWDSAVAESGVNLQDKRHIDFNDLLFNLASCHSYGARITWDSGVKLYFMRITCRILHPFAFTMAIQLRILRCRAHLAKAIPFHLLFSRLTHPLGAPTSHSSQGRAW